MIVLSVALSVAVVILAHYPTGVSAKTLTSSISNTTVNRGGSVDFTLASSDVGSANNTLVEITGGYLMPTTAELVPLVIWNVTSKSFVVYSGIATESPSFFGRVSVPSARVMRISNVMFTDQGRDLAFRMTYVALISRTVTSASFQLNVIAPPIANHLSILSLGVEGITEGDNVTMNCSFSGLPTVTITWTDPSARGVISTQQHIAQPNTGPTTSSQSMTITNIQINEGGKYSCQATNVGGQAEQNVALNVQYKPRVTYFAPNNASPLEDATVKFTCGATGNPNPAVYHYFFNGISMMSTRSNQWTLQLTNCSTSTGIYSCIAGNRIGNSTQVDYKLTVAGVPRVYMQPAMLVANESDAGVELSCYGVGCPSPSISYRQLGYSSFRSALNRFSFENISRRSAGIHSCIATNQHGSSIANSTIIVNYPPTVSTQLSTIQACLGEQVTIPCKADAIPTPNVKITNNRGGVIALSTRGAVFYHVPISSSHYGEYICHASNLLGIDTRYITIKRPDTASAPLDVSVTDNRTDVVVVSWKEPKCVPSSLISYYMISFVHRVTGLYSNFTSPCRLPGRKSDSCQFQVVGILDRTISYQVSVAAVDGSGKMGEWSKSPTEFPSLTGLPTEGTAHVLWAIIILNKQTKMPTIKV